MNCPSLDPVGKKKKKIGHGKVSNSNNLLSPALILERDNPR